MKLASSTRSAAFPSKSLLRCKRLLVPVDFSRRSRRAVKYAGALAQKFNAALDLLFVVEPPAPYAVEYAPLLVSGAELARRAKKRLEKLARTEVPDGVRVTNLIRRGKAWREIVAAAAAERRADLAVISTHGYSGMDRVILGSTAEQVIRRSACPVLTLRDRTTPRAGRMIRRILAPVDFSEASRQALSFAVKFARAWGAALTVFHVVLSLPPPRRLAAFSRGLEIEALKQARHDLADLVKAETGGGPPVSTEIATGIPRDEILRAAGRVKPDLLILATHGRTGLERWFMGSTAETMVRHAPCPVLVVRPAQRTRAKRRTSRPAIAPVPLPP